MTATGRKLKTYGSAFCCFCACLALIYRWNRLFPTTPVRGLPLLCPEPPVSTAFANSSAFVYATYIATPEFLPGVEALVASIFATGTPHPVVVLVTPAIHTSVASHFSSWARLCGYDGSRILVQRIEKIQGRNGRLRHKRYAENWTRMRMFELPYRKVIFFDADVMVLRNIDHLFLVPGPIAGTTLAENRNDDFNAGVMVVTPCQEMFNDMLQQLQALEVELDLTQRFYIYYFGRREIVWLPWKYNARPSNGDPLDGAYIGHFVYNDQRKKPWESTDKNDPWVRKWLEFAKCTSPTSPGMASSSRDGNTPALKTNSL